ERGGGLTSHQHGSIPHPFGWLFSPAPPCLPHLSPGEPPANQRVGEALPLLLLRHPPMALTLQVAIDPLLRRRQILQGVVPQLPGDALLPELLPDAGGAVAQACAVAGQKGGVLRVVDGAD